MNVEEGMNELEISDDPYDFSRIDIKNVPVFVTLNKVYITINGLSIVTPVWTHLIIA